MIHLDAMIPRAALARRLAAVSKSLTRRRAMYAGDPDVRLEARGSCVILTARGAEAWASRTVGAAVAVLGSAGIYGKRTLDLIESMRADQLHVRVEDDRLTLSGARQTVTVPAGKAPDAADPPTAGEPLLTLDARELLEGLRRTHHAIGKKTVSPEWTHGVRFAREEAGLRLTACDGWRMASALLPDADPPPDLPDLLTAGVTVRARAVDTLMNLAEEVVAEGGGDLALFDGPEFLVCRWTGDTTACAGLGRATTHWPDLGADPPQLAGFVVHTEALMDALQFVLHGSVSDSDPATVRLERFQSELGLSYQNADGTRVREVVRVSPAAGLAADAPFGVTAHGHHLLQALRGVDATLTAFHILAGSAATGPTRRILQLQQPARQYQARVPAELIA